MKLALCTSLAALCPASPANAADILLNFEGSELEEGWQRGVVIEGIQLRQDYVFLTPAPDRALAGFGFFTPFGGGTFTPGTVDIQLEGAQQADLIVRYRPTVESFDARTTTFAIPAIAYSQPVTIDLSSLGKVRSVAFGFGGYRKDRPFGATFSYIDNFQLRDVMFNARAAIPEPATWAMMIVGFGFVGAAARRGATRTATATSFLAC